MKQNERHVDEANYAAIIFQSHQAGMWTCLPAIVEKVNHDEATISARIALRGRRYIDDNYEPLDFPLLIHVPVVMPKGGGYSIQFPLSRGDEVLVVFSSRCIDLWWATGQISPYGDFRMHDLSDGFAIPGPSSKPKVKDPIPTDGLYITGPKVTIKAAEIVLDGTVTIDGKDFMSHAHDGVKPGGGISGGVA